MTALATPTSNPDPSAVLTTATCRAAERLGLNKAALAEVVGVSPATVTRWSQGVARVDPTSKEGEHALLLIRLFRALDSIVGNQTTSQAWLASNNHGLGGVPRELIRKTEGLVHVVRYLDASRARL
jgi:DNA-binding XRE family transcriptional regulator